MIAKKGKVELVAFMPLFLYIAIAVIFFIKDFLSTFWGGDFIAYYLPNAYFLLSYIKEGTIPLWQPYSYMGLPEFFQPALTLMYPPLWVLYLVNLLFNPSTGFDFLGRSFMVYNYLHLVMGAYFTYIFVKDKMHLSKLTSFFCGCVYSFGFFNIAALSDETVLIQRMWYPVLIYLEVNLFEKTSIRRFLALTATNLVIFSLGYPYNFIYFLLSQIFLSLFFGYRKTLMLFISIFFSVLIASFIFLPQINIYLNSHRFQSSSLDTSFHVRYSEKPTHFINIFIPLFGNGIFNKNDPSNTITMTYLTWGVVCLPLLLYGFSSLKRNPINLWLVICVIVPLLYSYGGYIYSIDLLSTVIPGIDKLRSHTQSLLLTYFAGVLVSGLGLEYVINGLKNKSISNFLYIAGLFMFSILVFTPVFDSSSIVNIKSNGWFFSLSRFLIFLSFSLLVINLYPIIGKPTFTFLLLFLLILEFNFYYREISFNRLPGSYREVLARNKLLPETFDDSTELYRYYSEDNQFAYNSSIHKAFQMYGYETTPYKAAYEPGKLPFLSSLRFSNVKYIVTTSPEYSKKYPQDLILLSVVKPYEEKSRLYLSSKDGLPWYTTTSKNNHYIYTLKDYYPRFFVPRNVESCDKDACFIPMFPSNTSVAENLNDEFKEQQISNISVEKYEPNIVTLHISASAKTFIASSEIWDKGWMLYLNGRKELIYKSNGGFRGFIVPPGESVVIMKYFPPNLIAGSLISLIGILLLYIFYRVDGLKKLDNLTLRKLI